MPALSVELPVRLPAAQCQAFVRAAEADPAVQQAYTKLRGGETSPSTIETDEPGRLDLFEPIYDPGTKTHGGGRLGWTITYTFRDAEPGTSVVVIELAYNHRTALLGFGLMKAQAQNELMHRIRALIAYERGTADGRTASYDAA